MSANMIWKELRNQVAVVLQKNVLFSGTILDNLRWGDKNATEKERIRACRLACADEFIERMPEKYYTQHRTGRKQCIRWTEAEALYCKSAAEKTENPGVWTFYQREWKYRHRR